jgi:hypothetical protein
MIRTEDPVMDAGPDDGKEDGTAVDDSLQVVLHQLKISKNFSRLQLLYLCTGGVSYALFISLLIS